MKNRNLLALTSLAILFLGAAAAFADPSCTDWMKQDDGSYWRTCVDDNGNQYCEVTYDGGKTVTRVKCTS